VTYVFILLFEDILNLFFYVYIKKKFILKLDLGGLLFFKIYLDDTLETNIIIIVYKYP